MNLLNKLFAARSPKKLCVRTYELFLEDLTVDQIFERLCAEGFSEAGASRAVTFMPSAFARVHHEKDGIDFPQCFYPGRNAYEEGRMCSYGEEPIFRAAMSLAEQLKRDGDWPQVLRFIEISAEHKAIEEGRSRGLTTKSIKLLIHEF